jgi:hypothetical protein
LPDYEGLWLLVSSEPHMIYLAPSEYAVRMMKTALARTGYYDCIGREVMEQFDEEDEDDQTSQSTSTTGNPISPLFIGKYETLLWNSSLWIPAKYQNNGVWIPHYMKIDTGAVNVGVPSYQIFDNNNYEPGKEQVHSSLKKSLK